MLTVPRGRRKTSCGDGGAGDCQVPVSGETVESGKRLRNWLRLNFRRSQY